MTEPKSNAEVLGEADILQRKTKESVIRLQNQADQMEILADGTIEQLKEQRHQMDRIQLDVDSTDEELVKSKKLLNRFGKWSGHWAGRDKRAAKAEAEASIKRDQKREKVFRRIKGVPSSMKLKRRDSSDLKNGKLKVKSIRKAETPITPTNDIGKEEIDKLDDEEREGLAKIKKNDNEIDQMLDHVSSSLDTLASLSLIMREETQMQTTKLEEVNADVTKTTKDFYEVNSRMRRFGR
uniref:t-SNARE coiled-coil homology domain-containing protein n=1 Tax=Helicotheca tamesis TaxID=374047 RepID=A0A7S2GWX9_9STRA|mmetsp:Transcript_12991/g.17860  ORF Transcript_12991/g.17860 Transcript_12991/m.17860 type:complete len:238 (+) Transcript_12991:178-891(+)|eukprot:CAMPEP_0185738494 /NCGR_PEP_ID=MMETSP1171-20130828/33135_1 /TAXON_ID=374046 /ORGANISM="Helicotheca tamensis, Strain CCMP826" /LENGTH=237 /DNA_ID=CAMNT_0028409757 /DNA_START=161 /DNA_END=874 /DNA_ORIENTATION=+